MGGGAYLDHLHKLTGSQHQKLVVIRNSEGVVAFCGGCDLANHRLGRDGVRGNEKPEEIVFPKEMGSAPWHDVQVRVEGGAAADLWQDFVLRFREATSPPGPIEGHGPTALREPTSADAQRHVSNLDVQVVRTFPNLRKKHLGDSLFKSGYNFAPNGELTYYELLINALSHTSKTIYLEDQYMVESRDMSAFTAITTYIRQALERQSFEKMIILLAGTETVQVDLYQAGSRRAEFIQQLGPSAASKVATYVYKFDPNSPFWFHSKTWIFDDSFAVVGSANCNRRSYSCDSEIGVGVVDRTYTAEGRLNFAHRLRMDLWLKHLNALPKSGGASPYGVLKDNDISNFVSASALWDKAPLLRRVDFTDKPVPDIRLNQAFKNKYPNLTKAISHLEGLLSRDIEWDLIDPDAS
jgi:phosphatidylserine/phosphatidylglycerophosphate/cardiolipin synthase-like enzyme